MSALRAGSARAIGIGDERLGQDFDRDVTIELVSRARYTSPIPPAPIGARISYTDRDGSRCGGARVVDSTA